MCEHHFVHSVTKTITTYQVEVIAPCGEVVSLGIREKMRDIDCIDGRELIKSTRSFFKELGFHGDDWSVRVTKIKRFCESNQIIDKTVMVFS